MRIVVDAMGSDTHPQTDVEGAVLAAQEYTDTIILVGDENRIKTCLDALPGSKQRIEVVHASQTITMTDKPGTVGKLKPESSMHIGMQLVRDQQADGFVSAGNTGAAHAIAMLYTLKRIPGVKRPALTAIFPILGQPVIFLDVGANTDSKPEWLVQFALMGSIYANRALGIENPRIGLLSNGEEEGKGSQLVLETATHLRNTHLNFTGNTEPKDVLRGQVDVMVADGFTGNILIKTFEASTRYLVNAIREELQADLRSKVGGLLARPAFIRARQKIDTFEVGGAPLLGVNGIVIISHGSSDARAIKNAVRQARNAVQGNAISYITEGIAALAVPEERNT